MNIKLGADPEIFYAEEGRLVSAFGVIQGDKKNPYPVENGAVQVDGMALEFNIDPAEDKEQWVFNLQSVLAQLEGMVKGSLVPIPVAEFGSEYIQGQPDEAKVLGCDPDFNAWTGSANPEPDGDQPFRTAAGHIHVGFTEEADINSPSFKKSCESLVRQLDYYLAIPSIMIDNCTMRREMYGKAGAYRPKEYGLEYRVLSNFWLSSTELMEWVFDTTQRAIHDMKEGVRLEKKYGDIQEVINLSDKERALEIINAEGWEVPNVSFN